MGIPFVFHCMEWRFYLQRLRPPTFSFSGVSLLCKLLKKWRWRSHVRTGVQFLWAYKYQVQPSVLFIAKYREDRYRHLSWDRHRQITS